jgi:motility quorum-sensing regulator/GCU-specific mRNA interferase toxin
MEKLKPTYPLNQIKAAFVVAVGLSATRTASLSAKALGFQAQDLVDLIQALEPGFFVKSMTSDADPRQWQDVYYVPWGEHKLYVKFTQTADGEMLLLSFKEKT